MTDSPTELPATPGSLTSVFQLLQARKSARQVQLDQHIEERELTPEQADKDECCNYWNGGVEALNEIEITVERWIKQGMDSANDRSVPTPPEVGIEKHNTTTAGGGRDH